MVVKGIPEHVAAFLRAHIRTVDDLHLLVAVAAKPDRWWDATSAADELMIERGRAGSLLEHLAAHNLLEIRVTGDVRYQFRPGTQELLEGALGCVATYRENPIAVWRVVTGSRGGGGRSVRDFADAFRIRRDDDG